MLTESLTHFVNGQNMFTDYPNASEQIMLGMGCFWGAERLFWELDGVHVTSVGYAGGSDTSPDYRKVCTGKTGHAEVVHVVYDPETVSTDEILKVFFENHDPTQGNRQGNDVGTQYRSVIFTYNDAQREAAEAAKARYSEAYSRPVTTDIETAPDYYPAEDYHQQYLEKNPGGYCNHGPTGITCPIPQKVEA